MPRRFLIACLLLALAAAPLGAQPRTDRRGHHLQGDRAETTTTQKDNSDRRRPAAWPPPGDRADFLRIASAFLRDLHEGKPARARLRVDHRTEFLAGSATLAEWGCAAGKDPCRFTVEVPTELEAVGYARLWPAGYRQGHRLKPLKGLEVVSWRAGRGRVQFDIRCTDKRPETRVLYLVRLEAEEDPAAWGPPARDFAGRTAAAWHFFTDWLCGKSFRARVPFEGGMAYVGVADLGAAKLGDPQGGRRELVFSLPAPEGKATKVEARFFPPPFCPAPKPSLAMEAWFRRGNTLGIRLSCPADRLPRAPVAFCFKVWIRPE